MNYLLSGQMTETSRCTLLSGGSIQSKADTGYGIQRTTLPSRDLVLNLGLRVLADTDGTVCPDRISPDRKRSQGIPAPDLRNEVLYHSRLTRIHMNNTLDSLPPNSGYAERRALRQNKYQQIASSVGLKRSSSFPTGMPISSIQTGQMETGTSASGLLRSKVPSRNRVKGDSIHRIAIAGVTTVTRKLPLSS